MSLSIHILNPHRSTHAAEKLTKVRVRVGDDGNARFKLNGKSVHPYVLIRNDETAETIKKILEFTTGIPVASQHLFIGANEIENATLALEAMGPVKECFLKCNDLATEYFTYEQPSQTSQSSHSYTSTYSYPPLNALVSAELIEQVKSLLEKGATFDEHYAELLPLCADSLIALQPETHFWTAIFGTFLGLESYLGVGKYDYVKDNKYPDTTKLRKAAPLYIIRALESDQAEIRQAAVDAMKKLITFFLGMEEKAKNAKSFKEIVLAISRGYYDSCKDEKQAKQACTDLVAMWQNNTKLLTELTADPYWIPSDFLNDAFAAAVSE